MKHKRLLHELTPVPYTDAISLPSVTIRVSSAEMVQKADEEFLRYLFDEEKTLRYEQVEEDYDSIFLKKEKEEDPCLRILIVY